jgi:hypothetical protein
VPPIITHHAARKSDVAAGTASCSMYSVQDSDAASPSGGAIGVARDRHQRALEIRDLAERHGQLVAQLAAGAPADAARALVRLRGEAVPLELPRHLDLLRREPRAADLDGRAVAGERARPGTAAEAVAGLEQQDVAAGVGEVARGAEAGEPAAHHEHVRASFHGARS